MIVPSWSWLVIGLAAGLVIGIGIAFVVRQWIASRQVQMASEEAKRLIAEAQEKQKAILLEAKEAAVNMKAEAEASYRENRSELQRLERRLSQKEENLERREESFQRREQLLSGKEREVEKARNRVEELRQKQQQQLEQIAGLSSAEARDLLLQKVEAEIKEEAARRVRAMELAVKEESEKKARDILSQTIQRLAGDVVAESTVSVVSLPGDEMKGRLIGREGRNIRALEHATGVDLIIDDTPGTVTLSCFDPVRREIARIALERLILDGRIHPARIEEMVQRARDEVETTIRVEGEQAANRAGVQGLPPELIRTLGRLKYRFSYGQNVLMHSVEVSLLAGMMAAEIGANVDQAKRAGLLHDIGKAVDFETEGPHAQIGADIVKQWEKSPEVIRAIASHHGEVEMNTALGFLVAAADAISASRPGARRESLEQYLKHLEALENIANSFSGVEKSYAIQAGREIRILVKPEEIDDLGAMRLARDIVKKVEETLNYPGQIKVTVVRETRAVDYAK
ncbi:MAG: ribonuclease Y [Dehalococcoidia bacterium]|nr:ribonuclease Y [Dehalococcoidia bacterium]